jgi:omega-amidase
MKETVNVSLVQFAPAWLDPETNARRMAELAEVEANDHHAELIVFPELASTGYVVAASDAEFAHRLHSASETIPGPCTEALGSVATRHGVHIVAGISQRHPEISGVLYNSAALIGPDGAVLGVHHKAHACLDEKNYYVAGNTVDVHDTELGRIALNTCYDVRFPEFARVQTLRGAEIIVSLWASFVQTGKVPDESIIHRCSTRAMENAVFFLGCNRSGSEGDRVFYGRSAIAAPSGDLLATSDNGEEEVVRARLEARALTAQREYLTIFRDRRPDLYGGLTEPL